MVAQMIVCELQFFTPLTHFLHQNTVNNPGTTFEALVRSLDRDFTMKAMKGDHGTLVAKSMQKSTLLMCLP